MSTAGFQFVATLKWISNSLCGRFQIQQGDKKTYWQAIAQAYESSTLSVPQDIGNLRKPYYYGDEGSLYTRHLSDFHESSHARMRVSSAATKIWETRWQKYFIIAMQISYNFSQARLWAEVTDLKLADCDPLIDVQEEMISNLSHVICDDRNQLDLASKQSQSYNASKRSANSKTIQALDNRTRVFDLVACAIQDIDPSHLRAQQIAQLRQLHKSATSLWDDMNLNPFAVTDIKEAADRCERWSTKFKSDWRGYCERYDPVVFYGGFASMMHVISVDLD